MCACVPASSYFLKIPYLPEYKLQLQHQFFTFISGSATYIPNAPFFLDYKYYSLGPRHSLVSTRTRECLGTRDNSRRGHIWRTWNIAAFQGAQRTVKMWCHRTELSSWKLSSLSTLTTAIAYACKGVLVRVRLTCIFQ